jgi:hypothetical protein
MRQPWTKTAPPLSPSLPQVGTSSRGLSVTSPSPSYLLDVLLFASIMATSSQQTPPSPTASFYDMSDDEEGEYNTIRHTKSGRGVKLLYTKSKVYYPHQQFQPSKMIYNILLKFDVPKCPGDVEVEVCQGLGVVSNLSAVLSS